MSPLALLARGAGAARDYAFPEEGRVLQFPRDHGAHLRFRIEWWYVTGWLRDESGCELGFQVTFFRSRPDIPETASRFAPRQLLFAHAAIADPRTGHLIHDQKAARVGFGLAAAAEAGADVMIDDWSMAWRDDGYRARIAARDFDLDFGFTPMQPILLQGTGGFSRKGPEPRQASHYYSHPQLGVSGTVGRNGARASVRGVAWLDHEWASEVLAPAAAGWDWVALNLDDGGAFMGFRIRAKSGGDYWAGGAQRTRAGEVRIFGPGDVRFTPLRWWKSPRTEVVYPVAMSVSAGGLDVTLTPLLDDQELNTRASTDTIYWEGAVRAHRADQPIGRGYLELTGYWHPLRL